MLSLFTSAASIFSLAIEALPIISLIITTQSLVVTVPLPSASPITYDFSGVVGVVGGSVGGVVGVVGGCVGGVVGVVGGSVGGVVGVVGGSVGVTVLSLYSTQT